MRALALIAALSLSVTAVATVAVFPVDRDDVIAPAADFTQVIDLVTHQARRSYFTVVGVDAPEPLIDGVVDGRRVRLHRVAAEPMPGEARYAILDVQVLDMASIDDAERYLASLDRTALLGAFADGARVFVFTTDAPEFHHHVSAVMARVQSALQPPVFRGIPEGRALS
jgi:hypothetical protein